MRNNIQLIKIKTNWAKNVPKIGWFEMEWPRFYTEKLYIYLIKCYNSSTNWKLGEDSVLIFLFLWCSLWWFLVFVTKTLVLKRILYAEIQLCTIKKLSLVVFCNIKFFFISVWSNIGLCGSAGLHNNIWTSQYSEIFLLYLSQIIDSDSFWVNFRLLSLILYKTLTFSDFIVQSLKVGRQTF